MNRIKIYGWKFDTLITIIPLFFVRIDTPGQVPNPCISLGVEWLSWCAFVDFTYKKGRWNSTQNPLQSASSKIPEEKENSRKWYLFLIPKKKRLRKK